MEPKENHHETVVVPGQDTVREEEETRALSQNQTVMETPDSTGNGDVRSSCSPGNADERTFVASLHCFMKDRGTPIERIPHLGFKQINLWRIYKAVEKLGGYESVTARRLWKSVYDELGGSPGSTSAATCTRRHYERLVLPFERERRGEKDKPLPQSKPRKQYKRGLDGKSDGKRKRSQPEKDSDSQVNRPDSTQGQTGTHVPSSPWTISSDRVLTSCPQPIKDGDDRSHALYAHPHLIPATSAFSWSSHTSPASGEVISPLEKKKRLAQESLSLGSSPRDETSDRPSVIHCSQSPGLQPSNHSCHSSEGSPLPLSSCSSRCSSPYSVSSEDGVARPADKPSHLRPESPRAFPSSQVPASSPGGAPTSQSGFSGKDAPEPPSPRGSAPLLGPLPADVAPIKGQGKPPQWCPVGSIASNLSAPYMVLPTPNAYAVKYIKVPSTSASGFTKVSHKSVEPLRPIPFQPGYRHLHNPNRSMPHDDPLTYAKRIHVAPPLYAAERKERSRQPTQQPAFHPASSVPVSYLIPAYDKAARDPRHPQGFHSVLLPGNTRLPLAPPSSAYHRHVLTGPGQSSPHDPAHYYPYPFPVWAGYSLHGANPHYSHTRL